MLQTLQIKTHIINTFHILQIEDCFGGRFLDLSTISQLVKENYNIDITYVEKNKSVYRVETPYNIYCLKVIGYEFEHFLFILGAIKHLQNNDFNYVPEIIKTINGLDYIKVYDKYAYLTPWINARESNYDNPFDVKNAAKKLGELHSKSENFIIKSNMQPRIGWFRWIETYKIRKNEILDFKKRIDKKECKSQFDLIYLSIMEEELKRCDNSIKNLLSSKYMEKMQKHVCNRGFCHHDYAHHNVLVNHNGDINIIDFDYCILDSYLHDLSSLLIRRMKYSKWELNSAREILDAYMETHRLDQDDIPIMAAFMEFPQDYWQRGIQYYWEEKPWGEEFFLKKLKFFYDDRDEKQEFIENFRNFRI
ncbi:CotS family spore coat protein [Clostridium argentinense]|nr:CotS family spore coat protein [Clostridium argentinense]NFP51724.1 CotS family spore coat protein [Clostridium argentinense]NFP73977.1 CotS family spore coat protein [Clostridium argentinense]NFP77105.1 CotS family spore coat protein [Clostridium argentinense]